MRGAAPIAGRIRWAALAITLTLGAALFIVTHGAQAGVGSTSASPAQVPLGDTLQLGGPSLAAVAVTSGSKYVWEFGDGTSSTGRRVKHAYKSPGYYIIRLAVSRASGAQALFGRLVQVQRTVEVAAAPGTAGATGAVAAQAPTSTPALSVKLQLLPQALRGALRRGLALQVSSNEPADGFATVWLPKAVGRLVGIQAGRRASVVIARGTVSQVKAGTMKLHLRLASGLAKRLARLHNLTLTVRMALVDAAGKRAGVDVTGNY
jgi:hypothetical protein